MGQTKPLGSCPDPKAFVKWYRGRAHKNMEEAQGPVRAWQYTVTEDQINQHWKVAPKDFAPGEVLRKIQECHIPCLASPAPTGEIRVAWSPKEFDNSRKPLLESAVVKP